MAVVSIPGLPLGLTGKSIPFMGFGTATSPIESNTTKEAILEAIKVGYRHFDTAAAYQTEKFVGEAIAEALSLGLLKSRDELFITSKLWPSDAHHDRVLPAIKNSLNKMGLEYLDLYLIHWPVALKGRGNPDFTFDKNDLVPMDFKSVWEAMEKCQELGLTKSIGVSNFSSKKLNDLLARAKIPPAVNQVEMSPAWQQKKIREFCEEKGILVTAYSPLGAKGTDWGTNKVMDSEVLQEIANAKGKTVAKICLRWVYEQGVGCIVKSYNKNRMKENLDIFDWRLNSEDLKKISEVPQEKMRHGADDFIHDKGPYKSLEELWDGEI